MTDTNLQEQGWTDEEVAIIEKFKGYGLAENLAIDCMVSRTTEEIDVIFRFLERYGDKLNYKQ
jgi:hypothetical protein